MSFLLERTLEYLRDWGGRGMKRVPQDHSELDAMCLGGRVPSARRDSAAEKRRLAVRATAIFPTRLDRLDTAVHRGAALTCRRLHRLPKSATSPADVSTKVHLTPHAAYLKVPSGLSFPLELRHRVS